MYLSRRRQLRRLGHPLLHDRRRARSTVPSRWGRWVFAVGAVVGAKMGRPDETCIALVGDGAFMMHGAEGLDRPGARRRRDLGGARGQRPAHGEPGDA